jgi:acetoin utilization protein AcuB
MEVREIMTVTPLTVTPATPVSQARRLLQTYRIRHLPVVDPETGRLVGILSDRDLTPPDDGPVETVMSAPVQTVSPGAPVLQTARRLADERIGALPVLAGDRLVGIVTAVDCLKALAEPTRRDER